MVRVSGFGYTQTGATLSRKQIVLPNSSIAAFM